MARTRSQNGEKRSQLRAARKENSRLMICLAEAAQREAQLQRLLSRSQKESSDLRGRLDFQLVRLSGFQLELEARHYELPFLAAQLEALLEGGSFTPAVEHILRSMKATIQQLADWTKDHKPSLDPLSWVMLARKLGLGMDLQARRVPAKRVEEV